MENTRLHEEHIIRVYCPHCGEVAGRIDHLFGEVLPRSFGDWYCDDCGGPYRGVIHSKKCVDVKAADAKTASRVTTLNLLRIDSVPPIWLIVKGMDFPAAGESEESRQAHKRYFYDEHTCPTNWIDDILAVIHCGDPDPHGFAPFVRFIRMPKDLNEDEADWSELFPEAFAGVQSSIAAPIT